MPGDVIVGDAEGVVVLPAALAEEIAHDALEQEEREAWALERVQAGESIRGIYPIADERRAEYERWRAPRDQEQSSMSSPFAADPSAVRGAITPLVTPFDRRRSARPGRDRAAGRLAARAGHARHLGRRLDRRADLADGRGADRGDARRRRGDRRPRPVPARDRHRADGETLELTAEAQRLGAAAALVVTPYYGRAQQQGLFDWYSRVASEFPTCRSSSTTCRSGRRSTSRRRPSAGCAARTTTSSASRRRPATSSTSPTSCNEAGRDFIALSGHRAALLPDALPRRRRASQLRRQLRAAARRPALRRVRRRRPRARAAPCTTTCTRWSMPPSPRPTPCRRSGSWSSSACWRPASPASRSRR